jgi:hypothetical protein
MRVQGQRPAARREQRFDIRLLGELRNGDSKFPVVIKNLSRGGALVEIAIPTPRVGPATLVRDRMNVEAQIVWADGRRLGLRFDAAITAVELFVQLSHNRALADETSVASGVPMSSAA